MDFSTREGGGTKRWTVYHVMDEWAGESRINIQVKLNLFCIFIEALAGLLAQPAGIDHLPQQDGRAILAIAQTVM